MPLAHESRLLKKLENDRRMERLKEACEAAKPLFDYFREERDRIQTEKGEIGIRLSIPIGILEDGIWGLEIPWNRAIRLVQAARYAEEMKAEANKAAMDVITGKPRPGWLRRILDRISGDDETEGGIDDCPHCKGLGYLGPITALNVCPKCKGEGWIDEDEDDEV